MTKEENIIVPRWFLENVENTLRIQNNINLDKETGETCQDRNVRQSLNGLRKLLKGEELTGVERFEKLQPSLPSNLDEAANNYGIDIRLGYPRVMDETDRYIYNAFKAGAEWMAGQGWSLDGEVKDAPTGGDDFEIYLDYDMGKMENILDEICDYVNANYSDDDNRYKVILQIRKKQ